MMESAVVRLAQALRANPIFWFVLAAAVVARLYHFDHLPDDAHEWRQTQTLMYAASYGDHAGWLTPEAWWSGLRPEVAVLEFPIYSIAVYVLSPLLGLVTAARVVSLL